MVDWGAPDTRDGARFDVLLATDVLYEAISVAPIAELAPRLLFTASGRLLLADPSERTVQNRSPLPPPAPRPWASRLPLRPSHCALPSLPAAPTPGHPFNGLPPVPRDSAVPLMAGGHSISHSVGGCQPSEKRSAPPRALLTTCAVLAAGWTTALLPALKP